MKNFINRKNIIGKGHIIRTFVCVTCLTGLLLPLLLGVLVREFLVNQGSLVVPLSKGALWVALLTFYFFLPYGLFAVLSYLGLKRIKPTSRMQFKSRLYILIGALAGMTISLGFLLVQILQNIKDLAYAVAFFPFTILGVFLWALGGGLIGAFIGWTMEG